VMLGGIATLMILVHVMFKPTRREMIIALFTGFYVGYWILTIFGTSFRGVGQDLTWPWDLPLQHH
jgi:menaquinol-cytochrome c reductase cytochrome b/c subunit